MFLAVFSPVPLVIIFSTITVSQKTLMQSLYTLWTLIWFAFSWWVVIWNSVSPLVDLLALVAFLLLWGPHWLHPGLVMFIGHLWTIYWCSGACRFPPPLLFPLFPPWNALYSPIQLPECFLLHFLLYRNVYKVNWYIFDQGEMFWGLWMRCRITMAPYPSYTSCTLNVDISWSQSVIIMSFNDIFNGTAKENYEKYMKMMEYLSSLWSTASTKVSAMCRNDCKHCLCSLPNSISQPKRLKPSAY
jgi:hypothetical protein